MLLQAIPVMVMMVILLLLLLQVTPVLSDIVTFASATNIAIVNATTKTDTFCITGGPQQSDFKLEDSIIIQSLLSNPHDKAIAKDVAEKIQKFYFRDKSNGAAFFSSATDVMNNFLLFHTVQKLA
jgi:transposase